MKWIKVEKGKPSDQVQRLLLNNKIGTPGHSMVYQHMHTKEKLEYIPNAIYTSLKPKNKVLGTCCFIEREITCDSGLSTAYYIRYFTFAEKWRSKGQLLQKSAKKKGEIGEEIDRILSGNEFDAPTSHLFYAYVDPENIRSRQIAEQYGFRLTGKFQVTFISRWRPNVNRAVRRMHGEEIKDFNIKLQDFYRQYLGYSSDNIGFNNNCFGYYENGKMVAGLQANPEYWKILSLPGLQLLLNLISSIPGLNRVFGENFNFMSIEGVYYEANHEDKIPVLISHCLAERHLKTAVLCMDENDPIGPLIDRVKGIAKWFFPTKTMGMYIKNNGQSTIKEGLPVYVSAFDVM